MGNCAMNVQGSATAESSVAVTTGHDLFTERRRRELTQGAVREIVGWSTKRIVDIEKGRRLPTEEEAKDYLLALHRLGLQKQQ